MTKDQTAFPFISLKQGLTARDYVAIKAMQGILSNSTSRNNEFQHLHLGENGRDNKSLAIVCYAIADAMIAESEKTK